MTNFTPKLEDATDEQLRRFIDEHNPQYAALSSNELTQRAVNKLETTINTFNKESSKQTDRLVKLTWVIVFLTVAMLIGLIIQIFLTF